MGPDGLKPPTSAEIGDPTLSGRVLHERCEVFAARVYNLSSFRFDTTSELIERGHHFLPPDLDARDEGSDTRAKELSLRVLRSSSVLIKGVLAPEQHHTKIEPATGGGGKGM